MRRGLMVAFIVGCIPFAGAVADSHPSIRKLAIVTLAKDTVRAAGIEAGLQTDFGERGIQADGFRTLFATSTLSVSEIIQQLRTQGYDSVLCLAPRKTIRITTADTTGKMSSLESCVKTFVTGTLPTGEPIDVNPIAEEPASESSGLTGSAHTPIPTNPAGVAYQIGKGTLRLFDLHSEKLLWQANIHAKLPADIQSNLETKLIVHEIWNALQTSGFISKF